MAVNFSKNRYGQSKGFSLVELLVTCTLGGILASLSMSYYDVYQTKTLFYEVKAALVSLQLSEQRYYLHHGHYSHDDGNAFISSDAADIHIQVTEQHTYQYRVNLLFLPHGHECKRIWVTPHDRGPSQCW